MDQQVFSFLTGMGYFTGMDWVTVVALLVIGALYFLAPALGYTTYNRGLLMGSIWVLIAKLALTIFKTGIFFLEAMDRSSGGSSSSSSSLPNGMIVTLVFAILESGLFLLAMGLFAGGLSSLRRDRDRDRDLPRVQPPRFPND